MSAMQLQYDPGLPHQVAAIDSVVDLFDGALDDARSVALGSGPADGLGFVELGFANPAPEDDAAFEARLLDALRVVQRRNGLEVGDRLDGRHFTVEMETGTGKTYVYLRTIFELKARYGLTKFVIVVPSVAIREGVLASLRSMGAHFRASYAEPIESGVYDSANLTVVRNFATASTLQVLVMNVQAFEQDTDPMRDTKGNVINRPHDAMAGRRPIEFIQAVRPVVVMDEPQNFSSSGRTAAIERLNPLVTLRYSATPKQPHNLVYRLGPVDAFEQGLVKQIEVDGVEADLAHDGPYLRLLSVDAAKARAQVEMDVGHGAAVTRKKVWIKRLDDLHVKANGGQAYADGYLVDDIDFTVGHERVDFTAAAPIGLGAPSETEVGEVQRFQVRETIRYHLDRELRLAPLSIKVLSLFFLDAVADYRVYDPDGTTRLGPIGAVFEEEYALLIAKPRYADLALGDVAMLHDAYFSQDRANRAKDTRGSSALDATAYEKIMRSKERLLSADEPLRFIFTHSALREGWDNPNVFQVCTLSRQKSSISRRQQIGRGLRLPVRHDGSRVFDRNIARLTVIANESYDAFARGLQVDYEAETGQTWGVVERTAFSGVYGLLLSEPAEGGEIPALGPERSVEVWTHLQSAGILDPSGRLTAAFKPEREDFVLPLPASLTAVSAGVSTVLERYARPPVHNAKRRERVTYRKAVGMDPEFAALWKDIAGRTRYRVKVDTERVVRDAVERISGMPGVATPLIRSDRADVQVSGAGIKALAPTGGGVMHRAAPRALPDVLSDLQNATELTRATLGRILRTSGREADFRRNPHAFTVEVTRIVRTVLAGELVRGIEYEQLGDTLWEMRRLEPEAADELERYVDRLYRVRNEAKSPYSHVEYESSVEHHFAARLDEDERVRFFLKLPNWFTIDTPVGPYNPDWAIGWADDSGATRVHLVTETKSTQEELGRRGTENAKIDCARRHFAALGTRYAVATRFEDLVTEAAQGD